MARRTAYTKSLGEKILARLSAGEPLAQICREAGMPCPSTITNWKKAHPDFATAFAEARDNGYDAIAADALRIADTPLGGLVEDYEEVEVPDTTAGNGAKKRELRLVRRRKEDMLGHRKLQVDTRLKLLAKWDPSRYGDKLQTEHSGEVVVHRKVFTGE